MMVVAVVLLDGRIRGRERTVPGREYLEAGRGYRGFSQC